MKGHAFPNMLVFGGEVATFSDEGMSPSGGRRVRATIKNPCTDSKYVATLPVLVLGNNCDTIERAFKNGITVVVECVWSTSTAPEALVKKVILVPGAPLF